MHRPLPVPAGFAESLEEYVQKAGLSGKDCTCGVSRRNPVRIGELDQMPRTGHAVGCVLGTAYGVWKDFGRQRWEAIKTNVIAAVAKMNVGDYDERPRKERRPRAAE